MQVESASRAGILKGVCCKENERSIFGSYAGESASSAGSHQAVLGLLVLLGKSSRISSFPDGGCGMGSLAS